MLQRGWGCLHPTPRDMKSCLIKRAAYGLLQEVNNRHEAASGWCFCHAAECEVQQSETTRAARASWTFTFQLIHASETVGSGKKDAATLRTSGSLGCGGCDLSVR